MLRDSIVPQSVDVQKDGLTVVWSNGETRKYPPVLLRQACPCAKCISEITGEVLLSRASVPIGIELASAETVGLYGVTFGFSDRHATGIYSYDYLYALPETFVVATEGSSQAQSAHVCGCGEQGCEK